MTQPVLYALLQEIPDNPDVRRLYGEGDQQFTALANVIASDALWENPADITLIIRTQPTPALGVMGCMSEAQRVRVEALPQQITHSLRHLRYVNYQQAERDCEQLASYLLAEIGAEELKKLHFAGLPRGGLIVLGMLAYILNLAPAQLTPDPDAPLVVVDDCALSGLRFGKWLQTCPNQQVIFAPLYSHTALRDAITTREARVAACISAHDLQDFAPDYYGPDYEAWYSRWWARAGEQVYWMGLPEHICFAWNEPENGFWNPVTQTDEVGWRVLPDTFCLKNRSRKRNPSANIQYQPIAQGHLKPAAGVLFGVLDEQVLVANIDTSITLSLSDVAAEMWHALIACPDMDAAVQQVLQEYDVDALTLQADFAEFIGALQKRGFLTE